MSAFVQLVCQRCGRTDKYRRALDPFIPDWVATLSQSHCDAEGCDTGDRHIETWLDAHGVARDPLEEAHSQDGTAERSALPREAPKPNSSETVAATGLEADPGCKTEPSNG